MRPRPPPHSTNPLTVPLKVRPPPPTIKYIVKSAANNTYKYMYIKSAN